MYRGHQLRVSEDNPTKLSPINIKLTMSESYCAAMVGIFRNIAAIFKGRKSKFGGDNSWQIHIEGSCGEMAVAKALGIYNPMTVNTFKDADLGSGIQVRTRSRHDYDLIIREGDADDEAFILVTGTFPEYRVHGWCWGRDGKKDIHKANHGGYNPAWFVPPSALRPLEELPKEITVADE